MNAKNTSDRMARPLDRAPPVPVERALVNPPPEMVIKCPHCGALGRLSKRPNDCGTIPSTRENRRLCLGCGRRLAFSSDWRFVRVIG